MTKAEGKLVLKFTAEQVEQATAEISATAREEGRQEAFSEVVQWLEDRYMKDDPRPDRGSPEGNAILDLVAKFGKYLREQKDKK